MESDWRTVGKVAVDAGMLWIGDPCYILFRETPPDLGGNWKELVRRIFAREQDSAHPGVAQFKRDPSEEGHDPNFDALGVTVATGFGDGVYDVEARYDAETGRIAEVRVVFIRREVR